MWYQWNGEAWIKINEGTFLTDRDFKHHRFNHKFFKKAIKLYKKIRRNECKKNSYNSQNSFATDVHFQ